MLVIILATTVVSNRDKLLIRPEMDNLIGPGSWSVDLDDADKVLRLVVKANIIPEVFALLEKHRFTCTVLNVYDTDWGVDYPLFEDH